MIYGALVLWFLVSGYCFSFLRPRIRKVVTFLFCAIPASLLLALRSEKVGKDTIAYIISAEVFTSRDGHFAGFGAGFEPADKALVILSSLTSNPGRTFIVVSSLLTIFIAFYAIMVISDKPNIVYCLYFLTTLYFFNLSAVRQSLAVSVIMLAAAVSYKKHWGFAILIVLCACLFHKTALIMLPVFILSRWRIGSTLLLPATVVLTLIACGFKLFDINDIFIKVGYPLYAHSEYAEGVTKLPFVFIVMLFLLYLLFEDYYRRQQKARVNQDSAIENRGSAIELPMVESADSSSLLLNRVILYAACEGIILCGFMFIFGTIFRMEYYILAVIIPLVPSALDKISSQTRKKEIKFFYYAMFIVFFVLFVIGEGNIYGVYQYHLMTIDELNNWHLPIL
ncbi:EpsG family protein [Bifidobacterium sp. ESL0732]|uniref:EpsG family protein n=1 Tax=Bifidobacterium sp. ESL0732 TaxID=2983222 RepID=UPI0023F84BAA|nr:EpsG family protein [Bifidobacterium sp. ESL0732]WEV64328.1 EpsG family protein [Bifidobacterium sp. ESL0732]